MLQKPRKEPPVQFRPRSENSILKLDAQHQVEKSSSFLALPFLSSNIAIVHCKNHLPIDSICLLLSVAKSFIQNSVQFVINEWNWFVFFSLACGYIRNANVSNDSIVANIRFWVEKSKQFRLEMYSVGNGSQKHTSESGQFRDNFWKSLNSWFPEWNCPFWSEMPKSKMSCNSESARNWLNSDVRSKMHELNITACIIDGQNWLNEPACGSIRYSHASSQIEFFDLFPKLNREYSITIYQINPTNYGSKSVISWPLGILTTIPETNDEAALGSFGCVMWLHLIPLRNYSGFRYCVTEALIINKDKLVQVKLCPFWRKMAKVCGWNGQCEQCEFSSNNKWDLANAEEVDHRKMVGCPMWNITPIQWNFPNK